MIPREGLLKRLLKESRGENVIWIPILLSNLTIYQTSLGVEKAKRIEKTRQLQRDREKPELVRHEKKAITWFHILAFCHGKESEENLSYYNIAQ